MAKYEFSPIGTAVHPWLTKADTKYNEGGLFKVDLGLGPDAAEKFKEHIQPQADYALQEHTKDMKPADAKKWSVFYPWSDEEDDDGKPTGEVLFKFRQNKTLKLKDGTEKIVTIGVVDAKTKPVKKPVYGGSELRVMYSMRKVVVASTKMVGIRLDFSSVQVIKLTSSAAPGFGEVEGGYSEDDQEHAHNENQSSDDGASGADNGGDY
jgi:hypothetical protein